MLRPAVLKKHLMLVRLSFLMRGLNSHRLLQSIIQLDLKLLSPPKVSSEGGTIPVEGQVADERAPSLSTADG